MSVQELTETEEGVILIAGVQEVCEQPDVGAQNWIRVL